MATLIMPPVNNRPQAIPAQQLAAADRLSKLLYLLALKRELAGLRRTSEEVRS
jgi:hypothetical protein